MVPGDTRDEQTVSDGGNLRKVKHKDGKEITDNKKTGETTISTPPTENSPGSTAVIEHGTITQLYSDGRTVTVFGPTA